MRFFFLLLLAMTLQVSGIFGQDITQTVRGSVKDRDTKMPLFGATVVVVGTDPVIGGTTDLEGSFRLPNVPIGRHHIRITYIGYKDAFISNLDVHSGKEVVLNLELEESATSLQEVTVKAQKANTESLNEMATISSRTFSVEETGRYAGSRNDVSRMAANYAGVSNANDSRNDIVIRGNSPLGLLWRLEELDIPSPNHFSGVGSNGGPISMLNYNIIANSDFMTSAFPAEYGNATSGVFDIKLREGNDEKREYMFQFGALGTELMMEGPMAKGYDGSFLLNYRFSTTSILTAMGIDFGYTGEADYQDLSFTFSFPTKKMGEFRLFGLGGTSIYTVTAEDRAKQESFDETRTENTNDQYDTSLGIAGLSHQVPLGRKAYLKTVVGFSGRQETGTIDSVSTLDAETAIPYFRVDNYDYKFSVHSSYNMKVNARNKVKAGIIADRNTFKMEENLYQRTTGTLAPTRNGSHSAYLSRMYVQWKYMPVDNWVINTGVYGQYFFLNDSYSLEPRLGAKWFASDRHAFSLGYGLHSQIQVLPLYMVNTITADGQHLNTNNDLDFTKSHHFVAGYDFQLSRNTSVKAEAYYQDLFNVPVDQKSSASSFSVLNEGATYAFTEKDSLVNEGTGQNYGLELTVERRLSRGYYYLLTSSLFDSKYKGSDGILRNTVYNGNYVFNILAGKEFRISKASKIIFDAKLSTAGGRRYTPIDREASQAARREVRKEEEAFSLQQDAYFRTDVKLTYQLSRKRVSHEFFINIDNVFNNQNIFRQVYSPKANDIVNVNQLGLFPTFQYKIMF